jgi:hypothetical protein
MSISFSGKAVVTSQKPIRSEVSEKLAFEIVITQNE